MSFFKKTCEIQMTWNLRSRGRKNHFLPHGNREEMYLFMENQFWFSNFLEEAFSEISLITWLKQFLKSVHWDFNVILGKQKTPVDIPSGVSWFPQGKQKLPGAIHNSNQIEIWITPVVFCFHWGKEKSQGGLSPGVFRFPRITLKSLCNYFKNSLWPGY